MSVIALAAIGLTVFVGSLVSGVFGIAGGMIMLGVLLVFFDVPTAMVLFSVLAATANAWRVMSWWRHINWRIMWGYATGGFIATVLMAFIAFIPSKAMVYLILGLIPYLIELLPRDRHPNIEWNGMAFFSGLVTTVIQLVAGNGGLLLDIFFQKSLIDRRTTVATKAICGTVGNLARVVYFGTVAGIDESIPWWTFIPAAMLAIAGTMVAPYILERMSDQDFRRWTRQLIFIVSAVYLVRALWLFWAATE
jgi:uncharacterized membrane protein YfcA